ncbi:hypothetical protein D3C76_1045190 [compost metagenome]
MAGQTRIDEDIRVKRPQKLLKLRQSPLLGAAFPVPVEPKQIDRAIPRQNFAQLMTIKLQEVLPLLLVLFTVQRVRESVNPAQVLRHDSAGIHARVIRMRPVNQRVVQPQPDSPFRDGFGILFDDIASGRRSLHHAQIAVLRIEQSYAVMVFRRQDRVLSPGLFDQFGPVIGIEPGSRKPVQLFHVVLIRNHAVMKGPGFGNAVNRVNPVMDKDPQLGVFKPWLHRLALPCRLFLSNDRL